MTAQPVKGGKGRVAPRVFDSVPRQPAKNLNSRYHGARLRQKAADDFEPTPPGAAGSAVDQNWTKTLPREAGWSICGVEIGEAKRKFRLKNGNPD